MFRGIFDDDTFIDDFLDLIGDLVSGVNETKGKIQKRVKEIKDAYDSPSRHEHSHKYEMEKTYKDGDLVESREKEWEDGELVKDEHYSKDGVEGRKKCTGSVCSGHCSDTKKLDNGDVEYTIELDGDVDTTDEPKCKEKESLRKCVKQLCDDAEKDHEEISELKRQVGFLRDELIGNDTKWAHREADLLETIERLEGELKEKDKLISAFQHLTDAVHSYDGCQKLNQ